MAYLGKGLKEDLLALASELEIVVSSSMTIFSLKKTITEDKKYEEEFAKELFFTIIEERKARKEEEMKNRLKEEAEAEVLRRKEQAEADALRRKEQAEADALRRKEEAEAEALKRKEEREFEIEKMKLEVQLKQAGNSQQDGVRTSKDIHSLMHRYDMKEDISLYLVLFERQAQRADINKEFWITHLLGLLPYEITQLIAREPDDKAQNYEHVKELLLKRFKLTPEKFRQLFIKHQKPIEGTWQDFYHELSNYLKGWITGLKVDTFEKLQDLIITDQMKKRVPQEFKEYYLDEWSNITSPVELAEKLEEFDDVRKTIKLRDFKSVPTKAKVFTSPSYNGKKFEGYRNDRFGYEKKREFRKENVIDRREIGLDRAYDKRKQLQCYECGSSNHLRPQCPKLRKPENVNYIKNGIQQDWLAPYTITGYVNGCKMPILRDTGATIDIVCQRYVTPEMLTGENTYVKHLFDEDMSCLPLARVEVKCELGHVMTKAAVIRNSLDQGKYILGNKTAKLMEMKKRSLTKDFEAINIIQTRSQLKMLNENKLESPEEKLEICESKEDEDVLPKTADDLKTPNVIGIDTKALIDAQHKSDELNPLIQELLKENNHEKGDNLLLPSNLLVKRKIDKLGEGKHLIIVPKQFRVNILKMCHEDTSGHLGVTKTKSRLTNYFFWTNCFKDVDNYVKCCDPCQRAGKVNDKKKAPLTLVPVISEVFSRINIDIVGPLPKTPNGNKYVLTALCVSSKYPEAVAIPNIASTSIVEALLTIFSHVGFPKEIQTDQGTSFMSALTVEFLERFGIKVIRSSVYHPQSNPVERFHRTLKRILRVLCIEETSDWEKYLPSALFALRTIRYR